MRTIGGTFTDDGVTLFVHTGRPLKPWTNKKGEKRELCENTSTQTCIVS